MNIEFKTEARRATVYFHGELTQETAMVFEDVMTEVTDYWQYDRIRLVINSPGGDLLALKHMMRSVKAWRAKTGGRLETQGKMAVSSAAAIALSLGDLGERSVAAHTQLLYHDARIVGGHGGALTAHTANSAAQALSQANEFMVSELTGHLVRGMGNPARLGEEGLRRCGVLEDRAQRRAVVDELGAERSFLGKAASTLSAVRRAYTELRDRQCPQAFKALLHKEFSRDQVMPVDKAWLYLLVDRVEGIEHLQHASPTLAQSAVEPVALKLAA